MFSEPHSLTDSGLGALHTASSVFGALRVNTRRASPWATAVDVEVALGRAIWAERGCAPGQVLHWVDRNQLLAVVDTSALTVAYRSKLRRDEVERAHMVARPGSASFSPEGFVRKSVHDILWQYGYYAPDAVEQLPTRLYTDTLAVKPRSMVTPDLLTLRHAAVLDALSNDPQTMTQLSDLMGMPVAQMAKALAPLYLSRCISTRNASRLHQSWARVRRIIGRGQD